MVRRLPTPRTPSDEYAAASYELLGDLVSAVGDVQRLLRDRLPSPVRVEPVTGMVRLTEPDQPGRPEPVRLTEPAPAEAPTVEPDPEPDVSAPAVRDLPPVPPRAGRGSSLPIWQGFADAAKVPYGSDDKRDDIVAACERAGVIPAQEG
jgi:hypothetical protein